MPEADANLVNFLKDAERFAEAESAGVETTWGDDAAEERQSSYLRASADASAEVTRQQGLTGQVLADDIVRLKGVNTHLEGLVVTIINDQLGYQGGRLLLVLASDVDLETQETILQGLVVL